MTALLKTYFLTLCFGVLASALLPKCLQKCGECMETVNNYDTRSCLSYCLDGKTDDQCNLFSVSAAKRGFGKRSLECKKFCFQCKLTYPQYNGNKCLEECEMSKGFKLDAHYKACHVILAVSCIIYFCNARLPQCLERCDHCKNLADGDYDIESCQSYCFRGSPDPHCSKFLTDKIKRGPIAKIWACIQYCRHCKLTYPQYNGEKCVSVCEESAGTRMDLNCMEYWPWNW